MGEGTRLIVFSKPPVPGLAKTRLSPPLTPEEAAAVHEASLRDVVAIAHRTGLDVEIRYAGSEDAADYFRVAFPWVPAIAQVPGDLGRRLAAAFGDAFARGAGRVLIMGSDSPTLPDGEIQAAARMLSPDTVVLGPAADGGYYMVGIHAAAWPRADAMFRDVPWSTADVFAATLDRLAGTGLGVDLLTPWYDIDRIQDLRIAAVHAEPRSHLGALLRRPMYRDLLTAHAQEVGA